MTKHPTLKEMCRHGMQQRKPGTNCYTCLFCGAKNKNGPVEVL